jgi:hypothetical protein
VTERSAAANRIQKGLEDANAKLAGVATDVVELVISPRSRCRRISASGNSASISKVTRTRALVVGLEAL